MRNYRTALVVVSDSVAGWPHVEEGTSDFLYSRLHGAETLYAGGYGEDALARSANRIRQWGAGEQLRDAALLPDIQPAKRVSRDVYCCFDDDQKVQAPFDARRLMKLVGASGEERS